MRGPRCYGKDVTITVLAENTAGRMGLLGEHGLSLWIETAESCVLFDTGQGLALPHNAKALDVALDGADAIVVSHGHYDHTGGLSYALSQTPHARLFVHPSALVSRFSRRDGVAREIGMPAHAREAVNPRMTSITWTKGPMEVAPGMFVTGPIARRSGFEDTGGPFFLDSNGTVPDPIEDDQAMWIETQAGLIVLLGCAHSGVVNTLDHIRERAGGKPIRAILGGMHLGSASDERVARTIESLSRLNTGDVWPCHCTGAAATARLTAAIGDRCRLCGVGERICF
jgi:7,8-dihydropterin-6-yl-methyl-4-(beta-D-ribofuranosyl)aminobenzene 5'-phosphate synthase